jgi:amino acid transporter
VFTYACILLSVTLQLIRSSAFVRVHVCVCVCVCAHINKAKDENGNYHLLLSRFNPFESINQRLI